MDVTNTPIGQSVVVADTSYIKSTFTRTSQSEGHIELRDPSSGKVVMKVTVDMNTGVQRPTWFDWDFWTVNVNGNRVAKSAGQASGDMRWNPQTKTIDITSK